MSRGQTCNLLWSGGEGNYLLAMVGSVQAFFIFTWYLHVYMYILKVSAAQS